MRARFRNKWVKIATGLTGAVALILVLGVLIVIRANHVQRNRIALMPMAESS